MMRGACLGAAAAIAASLAAGRAHAQTGATLVAVVTSEPASSLTRRVRAELEALGVDVIVLKPPDEASPSRAPLEQAARNVGAIAAIRLVPSHEGKVEVWVADRVTGKALIRELDAPEGGASDAAVALGSVELLRASLMELHSGERPRGDAPASDGVRALALPSPSSRGPATARLGLSAGAGVQIGGRGLGPSADADVGVWIRAAPHLGVRFVGVASVSPASASAPAGAIDVRAQVVGAMASYDPASASSAWAPSASIGVGVAHVSASGTATPPFVSASAAAWSAAALAGAGLAWSFAPGLRLRADGLAAVALPAARVVTPAGEASRWGAPALVVSLGVEVLWAP